jgi:type IV pilus assembly protein PilA
MLSSVMSRLNDRRDAAAELGEDAGFTLIELMVVLLILAILLAIAIPTFLGVTGGANDKAAQANLNTAITSLKTQATQNNQTYSGLTASTTTGMGKFEPSLTWSQSTIATAATVGTQGPVDFFISADGNGTVVVSFSKNSSACWYAVDNLGAVTDTSGPYGATPVAAGDATHVPTAAGTYYAKGNSAGSPAVCNPAIQPSGAQTPWASSFSGA